jgi:hypothetical protein
MERSLHIICFDHPFPPQYGGVIDVYFTIKALAEAGVSLHIHVFGTSQKEEADPLFAFSEQVYFYPLKSKIQGVFSGLPLSMALRQHPELLERLLQFKAPILFSHLKVSALAFHPELQAYPKFLRLQNVESDYYAGIARQESHWIKKQLYYRDSKRYRSLENRLDLFDGVFPLSVKETQWAQQRMNSVCFVPVFHDNTVVSLQGTWGKFALFHGDLRISDNLNVAKMLVNRFKTIDYPLVIASSHGAKQVQSWIGDAKHIRFQSIADEGVLEQLLREAHINVLWSFQSTGTKLKLMNCLYKSRFCLVNPNLTDDPEILPYCNVITSEQEISEVVAQLSQQPFEEDRSALYAYLDNSTKANKMIQFIFESKH